ncbi:hypothetical protein TNCV_2941351 [Trichonephila clavipes]|nr:hypothetical protein TNCV_2941351 [Trichonephila clavipes]
MIFAKKHKSCHHCGVLETKTDSHTRDIFFRFDYKHMPIRHLTQLAVLSRTNRDCLENQFASLLVKSVLHDFETGSSTTCPLVELIWECVGGKGFGKS